MKRHPAVTVRCHVCDRPFSWPARHFEEGRIWFCPSPAARKGSCFNTYRERQMASRIVKATKASRKAAEKRPKARRAANG